MGALLLYFVVGSIIGVPFLGYRLLRTQRDLNELRAELRRRGLIAPLADEAPMPEDAGERGRPVGAVEKPPAIAAAAQQPVPVAHATLAIPYVGSTRPDERPD